MSEETPKSEPVQPTPESGVAESAEGAPKRSPSPPDEPSADPGASQPKVEQRPRKRVRELPRDIVNKAQSTGDADASSVDTAKETAREVEAFDKALRALSKGNNQALDFARKYGSQVQKYVVDKPTTKVFRRRLAESGVPALAELATTYEFSSKACNGTVIVPVWDEKTDSMTELLPGEAMLFYAWIGGARNIGSALNWIQTHPVIFATMGLVTIGVSHFFTVAEEGERVARMVGAK